jgi:glycosyltransferase involved in cell wall biosynthesis/2-polyprenyl-3-methyl-5-hydroxy-6-metoxy-1,4-benzoquinol methylase
VDRDRENPLSQETRPRLLIFIVAYNAERTIQDVLARIPHGLADDYHVEVLVIDDSSPDKTFERGEEVRGSQTLPFKLHVLFNPINQGYGGNQKIGFHFAIERDFDFVALVHGDGQYAPECLPALVEPLAKGQADAVFGSRMMEPRGALRGGMPLYKFVGNKILTAAQNRLLRVRLSEFHSGYRVYSVDALRRIPFSLNTNDFHFDTEIIIQLVLAKQRIKELPIPTYYGEELCRVNGLTYAWNVTGTTLRARLQDLSLLYDRKFDTPPAAGNMQYEARLDFDSPHTFALEVVAPGSRVLDLGCAGGYLGARLRELGCEVTGVDLFPLADGVELDSFHLHDLDQAPLPVEPGEFDYVVLLDVIEHLRLPEQFMETLAESMRLNPQARLVLSTGNIAFALTRLLLLTGQFNYGKRGILDLTHTRLFTFATLKRLLDGAGFEIVDLRGVPAPFRLALGEARSGLVLSGLNRGLIRLRKQLFSYQIFATAQPRPSLDYLLQQARAESKTRVASREESNLMSSPDRRSG